MPTCKQIIQGHRHIPCLLQCLAGVRLIYPAPPVTSICSFIV
jgi:hypothetical protein